VSRNRRTCVESGNRGTPAAVGPYDEQRIRQQPVEFNRHGLRRIAALMADEQGRRELLERRVDELERDLIAVQARLAELERRLADGLDAPTRAPAPGPR
jgi:hypothetical protein